MSPSTPSNTCWLSSNVFFLSNLNKCFKTKPELKCQNEVHIFEISFLWKHQFLCLHYWDYLTNIWHNTWRCRRTTKLYTVHLCKCACMTCVTAIYCHWKWRTFVKLTEINLINTAIIAISTMTRLVNFLFKKHYAFFEFVACPLEQGQVLNLTNILP